MLRIKTASLQSTRLVLAFVAVAIVISAYAVTARAANQPLWPEGDASAKIEVTDSGLSAREWWHIKGCKEEYGAVQGVVVAGPLCVVHGKDVSIASGDLHTASCCSTVSTTSGDIPP